MNLRSCELLHPRLEGLLKAASGEASAQTSGSYVALEAAALRICSLLELPRNRVSLSAGSDAAIHPILNLASRKGLRLVMHEPNYLGWQRYPAMHGLEVASVRFGGRTLRAFSTAQLLEAVERNAPCMVVLSNPNSPTGSLVPAGEIETLMAFIAGRGGTLVIDECFACFASIDHRELLGDRDDLILMRSLSKSFGLAGLRFAITLSSPKIASELRKWGGEACISAHTFDVVAALLASSSEFEAMWADIRQSRDLFSKKLRRNFGAQAVLPSAANFMNVQVAPRFVPATLCDHLASAGWIIRDTSMLAGLEGCIRFAVAEASMLRPLSAWLDQYTR